MALSLSRILPQLFWVTDKDPGSLLTATCRVCMLSLENRSYKQLGQVIAWVHATFLMAIWRLGINLDSSWNHVPVLCRWIYWVPTRWKGMQQSTSDKVNTVCYLLSSEMQYLVSGELGLAQLLFIRFCGESHGAIFRWCRCMGCINLPYFCTQETLWDSCINDSQE